MKIGTRSILYGAHAFWWHPIVVLLAWIRLYKSLPAWWQLVAIFCHDLGYWGLPNTDGEEGKCHPWPGAVLTGRIVRFFKGSDWNAYFFSLLHSRDIAARLGLPVSDLYAADKYCVWFEPTWFYLWRVQLSGEILEFKQMAIDSGHLLADATDREWFDFYRNNVINRPDIKKLL